MVTSQHREHASHLLLDSGQDMQQHGEKRSLISQPQYKIIDHNNSDLGVLSSWLAWIFTSQPERRHYTLSL